MNPFERMASMSPLPIVDLTSALEPQDGIFTQLTSTCRKNLKEKQEVCLRHYAAVAATPEAGGIIQCPFGFSSVPFRSGGLHAAVTGVVPWPRVGGPAEQVVAKRHTEVRVPLEGVRRSILGLINAHSRFLEIEQSVVEKYSMALHEIRKLNRTVKQTAERLCMRESSGNPENARPELVTIWKTAELMTSEFDVIEVLANATQTDLPLHTTADPYRLFDKCVKIYRTRLPGSRRLLMSSEREYQPKILACDKTLHILPSVFIENAIKYSAPGTDISIKIESDPADRRLCIVSVESESEGHQILDDRVFQKGYRATNSRQEGSGNGLYVAQLIARQHNSTITVYSQAVGPARVRHTFRMQFRTM